MNRIVDEREVLRRLAALPREVAPQQDAWPLISARIERPAAGNELAGTRFRRWPLAIAASFVLILSMGLLLKGYWHRPIETPGIPDTANLSKLAAGRPDLPVSTITGELEYQAALKEFMALNAVSGASRRSEPEWFDQGWGALRQIELELTAALRAEPDNNFLKSRLADLRARQIELLRQIAAVEQTSWRNRI